MAAPSAVDVALRQQMVTERVKASQYANATKLRADIEASLKTKFAALKKTTFNDMTAADFQRFLGGVVKDTSGLLVEYKADALDYLEELTTVQRDVAIDVYEKLSGKKLAPGEVPDADLLWSRIVGKHMAANGLTMEQTLQSGSDYTMGLIVRRLRMAQADGENVQDTLNAILGDSALGSKDGLLNKLENAYRAGSNTNVQHVVTNTNAEVAQKVFDYYQWVSTLDDRTTAICQGRNGNVYKYGDGPMPPAHWNCRSTTIPAAGPQSVPTPATPVEWLATQVQRVRSYLTAKRPITLAKLRGSARIIAYGLK